jgi:hypothetical protein
MQPCYDPTRKTTAKKLLEDDLKKKEEKMEDDLKKNEGNPKKMKTTSKK